MEEKWDIYKYANFIFFVRSWTGELVYFTNYIPTKTGFTSNITSVLQVTSAINQIIFSKNVMKVFHISKIHNSIFFKVILII